MKTNQIIAHFASARALRNLAVLTAIMAAAVLGFLRRVNGELLILSSNTWSGIWPPFIIFGVAGLAYLAYVEVLVIWRLLTASGVALWIENGKIVYLHSLYLSRNCADVISITTGEFGRFKQKAVVLNMRDGTDKFLPVGALLESQSEIILRLQKCLDLDSA